MSARLAVPNSGRSLCPTATRAIFVRRSADARFYTSWEQIADEPDSLTLRLLREIRGEIAEMRGDIADIRSKMATKDDIAEFRSELKSDIADVASQMLTARKELGEQIVGLRRAVVEYHTWVIGHGVIISELEGRLRRVEQHLNLSG